jgi:hypothetical protein
MIAPDEPPTASDAPRAVTPSPAQPSRELSLGSLSPPPAVPRKSPLPAAVATRELTPTPSSLPIPPGLRPMLTLGSLHPPPVDALPVPTPKPKNVKKSPRPGPVVEASPKAPDVTPKFAMPSAFLPKSQQPAPKRDKKAVFWVAFAMLGVTFAVWARWSREQTQAAETTMISDVEGPAAATTAAPVEPTAPDTAADPGATPEPEAAKPKGDELIPEDLPLRDHDKVKKGQGILEVVTGRSDTIYIDGKAVGSGPVVTMPLRSRQEPYVVRVRTRGEERTRTVAIKEGRLARLRVAPPWQR